MEPATDVRVGRRVARAMRFNVAMVVSAAVLVSCGSTVAAQRTHAASCSCVSFAGDACEEYSCLCEAGSHLSDDGASCVGCAVGSYQPNDYSNATACIPCREYSLLAPSPALLSRTD